MLKRFQKIDKIVGFAPGPRGPAAFLLPHHGCDKSTRRVKFRFRRRANHRYDSRHPVPWERGVGHRHRTLGWDVVDAAASGVWCVRRAAFRERSSARRTNGAAAYGKIVWT